MMGCPHSGTNSPSLRCFAISLMVLVVCNSNSSSPQLRLFSAVEGRRLSETPDDIDSRTTTTGVAAAAAAVSAEKMMLRAQIGSRPPRCDGRCASCRQCEAIQVPTGPQINRKGAVSEVAYARGEGSSNYKPMSWKCKCGNLIFNP